jgi:hypothetical protein
MAPPSSKRDDICNLLTLKRRKIVGRDEHDSQITHFLLRLVEHELNAVRYINKLAPCSNKNSLQEQL